MGVLILVFATFAVGAIFGGLTSPLRRKPAKARQSFSGEPLVSSINTPYRTPGGDVAPHICYCNQKHIDNTKLINEVKVKVVGIANNPYPALHPGKYKISLDNEDHFETNSDDFRINQFLNVRYERI